MGEGSSESAVEILRGLEEEESMGNDELIGLQLGLSLGRCRGGSNGGVDPAVGSVAPEMRVGREIDRPELELAIGCSRYLERYVSLNGGQEAVREFLVDFDRLSQEEEELFLGSERANCNRDFQHKRAKVLFHPESHHYASMASSGADASSSPNDEDCNLAQDGSVSAENEPILFHGSVSNNGGSGNPMESSGGSGGDDDEDGCISKVEDPLVRMDLTDDLLHMVFSFLNHIDLCRAASVCRQWRAASAHEDFWRCLDFENRNISLRQFADMCHRYPNATELNILGAPAVDLLVMEAMLSLRNIETLILGKGPLNDTFFHSITDCHALKRLSISEAPLGNGVQEITIIHEKLINLQVIRCRVLRISIRCPLLRTLSLKRSNMTNANLYCTQLLELDIASCHKLSDAGIRTAATSCASLTSLDMSNCSCVSDETLCEIALSCLNLRVLNSSYCANISLESVRLPMLTVLKLHNCEGITSASMAAISHSYLLEELDLDCCGLLTSVNLDLPRLQSISLVHCRKFVDLNLRCLALSSITVSNCPVLQRINITSNCLQKLVLQKQESLTIVLLQCHQLQEVDLTECESLTNAICEVFNDGGGCPMLRSLVLDNCESLTTVGFNSSSLVSLSLVGCRAMTSLELACPNLQQIHLDGCDHLERASFCPVGLQSLNLGICPKLSRLQIEAPYMSVLELKGCGVLSQASIVCPCLTSLDASFCSQLKDDCLSATTASCPLIESLILMSCPSIGHDGLSSLCWLPCLTLLDLSYTFLMNLQPVFESCLQLKFRMTKEITEGRLFISTGLHKLASAYTNQSQLDGLFFECVGVDIFQLLEVPFFEENIKEALSSLRGDLAPGPDGFPIVFFPSLLPLGPLTFVTTPKTNYLSRQFESCSYCIHHGTCLSCMIGSFLRNFIDPHKMVVLKLQACKYLTNSSLDALYKEGALPALRELDLSYGTICQSAIEELLACCTHLTHVSLNGCINMHDLDWGSSISRFPEFSRDNNSSDCLTFNCDPVLIEQPDRLLQYLNCVGCPNIKKVVIPPMARCLHLSSLNLSLSANLKEVDLACFNLGFLNLSNCSSLEILRLECPRLSSLFLQSCSIAEKAVEAAISHCNMLETLDIRFCAKIYGTGIGRFRMVCPSLKRIFSSLVS